MKNRFFAKVKFKISHVQATIGQLFVSRQSLKTNLRSVWLNYKKSFIARPKMHLAVLGSLVLIIALIPIIGSIKRSQTSQAAGLQIQSVFPRIGTPTGGDKVIIKGQDFQVSTGMKQLFVYGFHTCALGSDNKAYCWGYNYYGQLGNNSTSDSSTPVAVSQGAIPGGVTLTQISSGNYHTCALGSNGKAYCWGQGSDGRLGNNSTSNSSTPVAVSQGAIPGGVTISQISPGFYHTCALGSNGKAYCWGKGEYGQLGNNSTSNSSTPVAVSQGAIPGGITLTQISSGNFHTCALGSDNKAYCWGQGSDGRLGNNSTSDSSTPVAVSQGAIPSGVTITHISSSGSHTCAIASNGKAYCWGYNYYGQLGNNSTSNSSTPVAVAQGAIPSGVTITQISAGYGHACALGSNNKAYCWGEGDDGQLGNNSTSNSSTPVAVAQGQMPAFSEGTVVKVDNTPVAARYISPTELEVTMPARGEGWVNISVSNPDGSTHTLNQAYQYYQAKNPVISSVSPDAVHPYGGEIITIKGQNFDSARWKHVSAGDSHACAIASNGKAYCWGSGSSGKLGNNSTSDSSTPVAVSQGAIPSGVNLTQISLGSSHACAIASNGKAYCWGYGYIGRLGNGSTADSSVPVAISQDAIPFGISLVQVSSAGAYTCALGSNGKAYCWGHNNYGQLGNNSTADSSTPVAVAQGQIPSGTALTQISTGYYHTCALGSNGKVYCWGYNNYGQLGNNSTSNSSTPVAVAQGAIPGGVALTQISSGSSHTCAIASNSKAYCWGNGGSGQLGNNSTSNSSTPVAVAQGAIPGGVALTQISSGSSHTCAIGSNNKAYCWGNGGYGELGGGSKLNKKVPVPVINGHTLKLSDGTSSTQYAHGETGGYSDNQIKIRAPAGQAGLKSVTLTSGYLQTDSNTLGGALTYAASQPKLERLQPTSSSQRTVTSVAATGAYLTNLKASDFTYISSGGSHTCALGSDNKAYCWGYNYFGQLGNNSTTNQSTPVAVSQGAIPGGVTLTHISSGGSHTCAIASNGKAYCWGYGSSGRLGNNSTSNALTPVAVSQGAIPSGITLTHISAGYYHTCALGSNNKAYCWGRGEYGQLGNNSTSNALTPVAVSQGAIPSDVTLTQISAGDSHTCALGSNNKAYCWGNGGSGRLGNNSTSNALTPVAVSQGAIPSGITLTHISAGYYHTCAIASNGKAYCWGYGSSGRLGNNWIIDRPTPVPVLTKTALTISFGSGYNATDISLNVPENSYYATSLTLKTPSHPAGQVPVVITNPDGQSNASQSDGKNLYTFYGVPPAPSSLTAAPSKPLGSITLSFKSPSTGGIDNQPNAGNNYSPITDYKIEYCIVNPAKTACQDPANSSPTPANPTNWTTHPHAAITSNSTNPLTISISNLNQSNNYLFRVAAINQTGTGAYAQATATMPSYVSLSATANVDINITPIHEGTVSTGSILVDYATNIPTGYSISVKASGNNTALGNGPFHTVASRLPNSARLQPNQWGFRLPNIAKNTSRNNLDLSGYSANTQLVTNLNQTSHTDTYSFIPPVTSVDSIDISRYSAPDTGQRQMIVGFNAAKNLQSGRYTGILMFTMIGG